MKNIVIVSANAGYGHRATEIALKEILCQFDHAEVIRLDILTDILAKNDPLQNYIGINGSSLYNNYVLKNGFSFLFWNTFIQLSILYIRLNKKKLVNLCAVKLNHTKPDLIISIVPFFNEILLHVSKDINCPFVTLMIDFNNFHKHAWIQHRHQVVFTPTEKAYEQAVAAGLSRENIIKMNGVLLASRYCEPSIPKNHSISWKIKETFKSNILSILIVFGGVGMLRILKYARALEKLSTQVNVIFVCGLDADVANSLSLLKTKHNRVILGFVPEIDSIYDEVDIVIGKPGPGIVSEAIAKGKPLILESNVNTLYQERYNVVWALEKGVALTFSDCKSLVQQINYLTQNPNKLMELRMNCKKHKNNSINIVYEFLNEFFNKK